MHEIQQKLIKLAKEQDITSLGYRKIGRLIDEEHPQKVKFHLLQLKKKGYLNNSKGTNVVETIKDATDIQPNFIEVPILGAANCGEATIFADDNIEGYLKVSSTLATQTRGLYALRAEGNSMNRANIKGQSIESGDYVLVTNINGNYGSGDYVVSIIDSQANIKKLGINKKAQQITLHSESTENIEPIYIDTADSFLIVGKVVKVIKTTPERATNI